jgi:hypothetical protein
MQISVLRCLHWDQLGGLRKHYTPYLLLGTLVPGLSMKTANFLQSWDVQANLVASNSIASCCFTDEERPRRSSDLVALVELEAGALSSFHWYLPPNTPLALSVLEVCSPLGYSWILLFDFWISSSQISFSFFLSGNTFPLNWNLFLVQENILVCSDLYC